MTESKKDFLEFVRKNPPPCVPGDDLYWLDSEDGKIKRDSGGVKGILLDNHWNWYILEYDNEDIIIPNSCSTMCLTFEAAKKFRDEISSIKYAIFEPSDTGKIINSKTEDTYSYVKTKKLNIKEMKDEEGYVETISRIDKEVAEGMVLCLNVNCSNAFYLLSEENCHQIWLESTDKVSKRILEDIFD